MAGIVIKDLVKKYPGTSTRATDDISLAVADGEFLVHGLYRIFASPAGAPELSADAACRSINYFDLQFDAFYQ